MSRNRIFTLIWLIISQLGGGVLVLYPVLWGGILSLLTLAGGGAPFLFMYTCGAIFVPLFLAIASWIAFLRKKDLLAAILSGICFLIDVSLFIGVEYFNYPM